MASATAVKFGRFLLVGGLCTGLQYLLLIGLVKQMGFSPTISSTVGYLASSGVNYWLSHRFTYASASLHRTAMPRFLAVGLCGMILNAAIMYLCSNWLGVNYLLAQVAATCCTLVWNFIANLLWTF